jgi:hypothetical protein
MLRATGKTKTAAWKAACLTAVRRYTNPGRSKSTRPAIRHGGEAAAKPCPTKLRVGRYKTSSAVDTSHAFFTNHQLPFTARGFSRYSSLELVS